MWVQAPLARCVSDPVGTRVRCVWRQMAAEGQVSGGQGGGALSHPGSRRGVMGNTWPWMGRVGRVESRNVTQGYFCLTPSFQCPDGTRIEF